jgi:hypothetical protein
MEKIPFEGVLLPVPCGVPWGIQGTGQKNTGPINVSKCLVILGEVYDHVDTKDLV